MPKPSPRTLPEPLELAPELFEDHAGSNDAQIYDNFLPRFEGFWLSCFTAWSKSEI